MTIRQVFTATGHGNFANGQPKYGAAHDLEAPVRAGLAYDLATGWVPNSGVGPHFISDPRETIQILDTSKIGYHLGNGNNRCIGFEVTGYARFSRAEWLAPESLNALRNQAEAMALCAAKFGWELRWLSLAEIAGGQVKGFITHNDARQVWGGTTHTDPGPGYPYDVVMKMVQQFSGQAVTSPNTPNPQPAGIGGADSSIEDDDDMALSTIQAADGPNKAAIFAVAPGHWHGIEDMESYLVGVEAGVFKPVKSVANQRSLDVARAVALQAVEGESNISISK